jgi:hypothetical protein
MLRLRNASPNELDVFAPAGEADSLHVQPGQEITVNGDLAADQPADAYQVGEGDDARLWPHSLWQLVEDPKSTVTPPYTAPVSEEN